MYRLEAKMALTELGVHQQLGSSQESGEEKPLACLPQFLRAIYTVWPVIGSVGMCASSVLGVRRKCLLGTILVPFVLLQLRSLVG